MRFVTLVVSAFFVLHLPASGTAAANDWPASVKGSCDDPYVLKAQPIISGWIPAGLQFQRDRGGNNIIAELSSRVLRKGIVKVGYPFQEKSIVLTAPNAAFLREAIAKHTDVFNVPWYIGLVTPPPIMVESEIGQSVLSSLIKQVQSGLKSEIKSIKLNAEQLNLQIVAGGELVNKAILLEGKEYFTLNQYIEYTVKIGEEQRTFVLVACTYPAKVGLSKFTLLRTDSSKASVFEEDESGTWIWRQATDAGGGIAGKLKKTGEDSSYIYFESLDTCGSDSMAEGLCDQYRGSKRGLDWSSKWNSDATWEAAVQHGGGPMADKTLAE